MAERIEYPPELQGETDERIRQIHRYLRRIVEQMNSNQTVTDENLSEYISAQANALKSINGGSSGTSDQTNVRDVAAELVDTMTKMLQELQRTKADTVTTENFQSQFIEKARTTSVVPVGGSTGFIIATAIQALTDTTEGQTAEIGRIQDEIGETISGTYHGYLYSGEIGRDGSNNPIYGTAIGPDVVTWDANNIPTYNAANAWVIFGDDGHTIGGSAIATAADLAEKANAAAGTTQQTDADQITAAGKYIITITAQSSNFPRTLSSGETVILETETSGSNIAMMQRIWTEGVIYTRTRTAGTWSGWYAHAGNAV